MLAALVLALIVGGSLVLPEVLPYRYDQQSLDRTFEGPSGRHWLGTDQYGRDLLVRLAQGGRISLLVGIVTVLAEVVLGGVLGGIAGYAGGRLDEWLMRLTDMMLAFPALLLALLLAAILGPGTGTVVAALALAGWPAMARTVRGEILSLKEREFVVAARAQGASAARVLLRHLLQNTVHLIVVRATLDVGPIILTEATLSFLGLGVQRPMPSWGVLIADPSSTSRARRRSRSSRASPCRSPSWRSTSSARAWPKRWTPACAGHLDAARRVTHPDRDVAE